VGCDWGLTEKYFFPSSYEHTQVFIGVYELKSFKNQSHEIITQRQIFIALGECFWEFVVILEKGVGFLIVSNCFCNIL
jgi:hypothetical protein